MGFTGKSDSYLQSEVTTGAFWPVLSLGDFQKIYRIPAEYEQAQVEHFLKTAAIEVNGELADEKALWTADGYESLASVDDEDDQDNLVHQYLAAVCYRAKGFLLKEFPTINRRDTAENEAKSSEENFSYYLAMSRQQVRRMKGLVGNAFVELI